MLKQLKFSGIYYDDDLSVNITLENPYEHNFTEEHLLFSVKVRNKGNDGNFPKTEDFTLYIMDEANCMYNTKPATTADFGNKLESNLIWLVFTEFKRDFLFQDMRIAVYYHPYQIISIINLNH